MMKLNFSFFCHLCCVISRFVAGSRYYKYFIKAIGQKHVSYLLSSDAIVDNAIKHEINHFNQSISQRGQHWPFLICSGYFESNIVKEILRKEEFHITYSSMLDSTVCFVHYSTLQQYLSLNRAVLVSAAPVFIHVPIPSILKFDKNIQLLQYYLAILGSNKNPTSDVHLLESILSGTKAGISISFKRSCSKNHQDESLHSWLKGFANKDGGNTMRRLFWYSSTFQPSSTEANKKRSNDVSPLLMHRKWRQWSDLEWSSYSNHSIQHDLEQALHAAQHRHRSTYIPLPKTMLDYLHGAIQLSNSEGVASMNVSESDIFAAFFARFVSILAVDNKVTRISFSRPMKPLNKNARAITQSGVLNFEPFSVAGLNGSNTVVGVSDTGIDENSCYFKDGKHGKVPRSDVDNIFFDHKYRKVIQYVNWSGSGGDYRDGHGSHVSGTLAGECKAPYFVDYRGIASAAKIAFFDIGINDQDEDLSIPYDLSKYLFPPAYAAGARVHSNSWGGGYWYDSYCIDTDEYLFQNQDVAVFFAGGNDGSIGIESVLSPALAKNAVAVGCTSNSGGTNMDTISYFSSHGPSPDGRIKPDILAPGYSIYSVAAQSENKGASDSDCALEWKAGTSMAAPVAAANALLIRQYFTDSKFWAKYCKASYPICSDGAFNPSGVLLKAILLHSGVQVSSEVNNFPVRGTPDNYQGYGRINLLNVLPLSSSLFTLFVQESYLAQMQMHTFTVTVSSQNKPLKVTLSWYDPPNEVFSAKCLLHDLDVVVTDPSGQIYYGNSHGSKRDELNNNEQVLVSTPMIGAWTVSVQSKLLSESLAQNYSLVITTIGVVDSSIITTALNPSDFSYCPPSSSDGGMSRMEVDLALFSRLVGGGWGNGDTFTLSNKSTGAVVSTGSFSRSPSTVMLREATSCLPTGCYSVNFNMVGRLLSVRGSSMAIPQCGVFLAALAPSQDFCVVAPALTVSSNPESSNGKCTPQCLASDHVLVPFLPFEDQGSGWTGAYYFIQPTSASSVPTGGRAIALSAGTLESGYGELKFQCLPLRSQCYALQLSFAKEYLSADSIEYPQIFIPDANLQHQKDGINDPNELLDLINCPYQLNISFPIAKFCVDENDSSGHGFVTFYAKKDGSPFTFEDFGQLPESDSSLVMMQSSQYLTPIGKCVLNIIQVRSQSSTSPTEAPSISTSTIPSSDSTTCPSYLPSSVPSSDPTDYPTFVPTMFKSISPTPRPSINPTSAPSVRSTYSTAPSIVPSAVPSYLQSIMPTSMPSCNPIIKPTADSTSVPSSDPSTYPTIPDTQSVSPSALQSHCPIHNPSAFVTKTPSMVPTSSMYPTAQTATSPSIYSFMPSRIQSFTPTRKLSASMHPSEIPVPMTAVPTKISQSKNPSISPIKPTRFPSIRPTETTQPKSPTMSPIILRAFPSTLPTKTIQSKSPTDSPSVAATTPPAKGAEFHSNLTINNAIVASQSLDGITLESFNRPSVADTFISTVAQILNVSTTSITILNITAVSKQGLQFKKHMRPSLLVKYEVFTLATQSLETCTQLLANSVYSGSFTTRMHNNAVKYNVSDLFTASTSSVSIISGIIDPSTTKSSSVPIQTPSTGPLAVTSLGKYATVGVVVGTISFLLLSVAVTYYFLSIGARSSGYVNLKLGSDLAEDLNGRQQPEDQVELVTTFKDASGKY